ncbi:hypothetical protein AUJ68_05775 [Candidatus Woesearchaeota archaeon CG1_02_57_44]|nr:MAG: hypothetical protein AUJ68_05775 [Candidatus Woesearchaeota archaeon CG1_02_57_44]
MKDPKRLSRVKPNLTLARRHLQKSEYNYIVLQTLEEHDMRDWALNAGFYAIYHCFLAILAKYGYASRNQACTITALQTLIAEKAVTLERDLIAQFDTLDPDTHASSSTIRASRELSTYGVETSIDLGQLKTLKELILTVQRETIRILAT